MTAEIAVMRLPPALSNLVDEVVGKFVQSRSEERVHAYHRYHDADLWMVYTHRPTRNSGPGFVTRRVTIGVYSDRPSHLKFIPDIVLSTPVGRFTVAESPDTHATVDFLDVKVFDNMISLSVPDSPGDRLTADWVAELNRELGRPISFVMMPWSSERVAAAFQRICDRKLLRAWKHAHELDEAGAVQPIL
jgi:hypothetical protein